MTDDSKKQWTTRRGAQPVADLVSKLLDPVIERRAGMTMDLIASWEEIVGQHHGTRSRPEKLTWPRQPGGEESFEAATLVVACEGGHALFLQHDGDTVLSQVNDYFGFTAVNRLKLVQKPIGTRFVRERARRLELDTSDQAQVNELIKNVEDKQLKQALEKLGRGVFSQGSSTKD